MSIPPGPDPHGPPASAPPTTPKPTPPPKLTPMQRWLQWLHALQRWLHLHPRPPQPKPTPKPKPPPPKVRRGADWAWGGPSSAEVRAAGFTFACRYLSTDAGKNLTLAEARTHAAHGIDCVVVWETTANRALDGRQAGIDDANAAKAQAAACGMPKGRPIYFAVDFDASTNPSAIVPYFRGASSVMAPQSTGVYGGLAAVRELLDNGACHWAWQTYAWSGGQWDNRAQLRQVQNGIRIAGHDADLNESHALDFGAWRPR